MLELFRAKRVQLRIFVVVVNGKPEVGLKTSVSQETVGTTAIKLTGTTVPPACEQPTADK